MFGKNYDKIIDLFLFFPNNIKHGTRNKLIIDEQNIPIEFMATTHANLKQINVCCEQAKLFIMGLPYLIRDILRYTSNS